MTKLKIKTGDQVVVIAGKDKGARGEVLSCLPRQNRVRVSGVGMVKKALRPTRVNPGGGLEDRESAIDVSNVQLLCPECGLPTRVTVRTGQDKKKIRVCQKCGKDID